MSHAVLNSLINKKRNFVLNATTGGDKAIPLIKRLRVTGYTVNGHFIDLPTGNAIDRSS